MQKDLKTQNEDDFEKLLQDFIDGALDSTEDDDDLETFESSSATTRKSTNAWMTSLPLT